MLGAGHDGEEHRDLGFREVLLGFLTLPNTSFSAQMNAAGGSGARRPCRSWVSSDRSRRRASRPRHGSWWSSAVGCKDERVDRSGSNGHRARSSRYRASIEDAFGAVVLGDDPVDGRDSGAPSSPMVETSARTRSRAKRCGRARGIARRIGSCRRSPRRRSDAGGRSGRAGSDENKPVAPFGPVARSRVVSNGPASSTLDHRRQRRALRRCSAIRVAEHLQHLHRCIWRVPGPARPRRGRCSTSSRRGRRSSSAEPSRRFADPFASRAAAPPAARGRRAPAPAGQRLRSGAPPYLRGSIGDMRRVVTTREHTGPQSTAVYRSNAARVALDAAPSPHAMIGTNGRSKTCPIRGRSVVTIV